MQYKVKKACTLPDGNHRYVEAGEVVELDLPKGQKPPKHLEPIPEAKPQTVKPVENSKDADHSRPEDLYQQDQDDQQAQTTKQGKDKK